MTEVKKEPGIGKLIFVLFLISTLTALALGLTNYITKDKIAAIAKEKTDSAMSEVLQADTYDKMEYTGTDTTVTGLYKAGDAGYVIEVAPVGFSGPVSMVVGIAADKTVSGVTIIKHAETSGLGSNATKPEYKDQYKGGAGPFAVNKDGGEIQALTGATITSRAVTRGVNSALDAVAALN